MGERLFPRNKIPLEWPYIIAVIQLEWPYLTVVIQLEWPYIMAVIQLEWPYLTGVIQLQRSAEDAFLRHWRSEIENGAEEFLQMGPWRARN